MSSNRELREEAEALGVELGVSVDTDGLNNAALKSLVDELYAQLETRDAADPVPPVAKPPPMVNGAEPDSLGGPPEPMPDFVPVHPYTVAPGYSISSQSRGMRKGGQEIRVGDFGRNLVVAQQVLDAHVAAGRVIQR